MDIEKLREYCLKKKRVTEGFPFGDDPLVFKVMGKMFCLVNLIPPLRVNLKCDPEKAIELREKFDFVLPGYHMNKQNWNTINLGEVVKPALVYGWIDDSYNLVVDTFTKKLKEELRKIES